jgi:hypothetical protein
MRDYRRRSGNRLGAVNALELLQFPHQLGLSRGGVVDHHAFTDQARPEEAD